MKKGWKITLITLFSLLLLVLVGPFLVPIPPLEATVPPETRERAVLALERMLAVK